MNWKSHFDKKQWGQLISCNFHVIKPANKNLGREVLNYLNADIYAENKRI